LEHLDRTRERVAKSGAKCRMLVFVTLAFAGIAPALAMRNVGRRAHATMMDAEGALEQHRSLFPAPPEVLDFFPDRPWWAPRPAVAPRGGIRWRIRHTLRRHLGLLPGVLDPVLDRLPIHFSLAAALVRTPQSWNVVVWELAVPPAGQTPGVYGGKVSEFLLSMHDWPNWRQPLNPFFFPGNETLVTALLDFDGSHTVLWDVRHGRREVTMDGVEIMAVSRGGDAAVGNADNRGLPAIWRPRSGERVSAMVQPQDPEPPVFWSMDAKFSPSGRSAAVIRRASVLNVGDPVWSISIFNSGRGTRACEFSQAFEGDIEQIPPGSFDFDGDHVAICRGSGQVGIWFEVRWEADRCKVVHRASRTPCDAVFLSGQLYLEVAGRQAKVCQRTGFDEGVVIHRGVVEDLGGRSRGLFAPDGRKVLFCGWTSGACYVWSFADGHEPQRLAEPMSDMSFVVGSTAVVGLTESGMELVCFDLSGSVAARFGDDAGNMTGLAIGEAYAW